MSIFKEIKERGQMNSWYKLKVLENDADLLIGGIKDLSEIKPMCNIYGIPVIKCTSIINSSNAFIAMLTVDRNNNYYIIVDDLFMHLSKDAQMVILGHEIGHYHLNHLNTPGKGIHKEYEADEYAAKMFGYVNTLKALDELVEIINKLLKRGIVQTICLLDIKKIVMQRKHHLMK